MTVQKEFKKTSLEDRLLKAGGRKPILPCATRWTSQRNSAESFLANLSTMKTVTAACDAEAEIDKSAIRPKPSVSQLLFDFEFIDSVKELLQLLSPVAELTNKCQKSDCSVADALEEWMKLSKNCPEDLLGFLQYRCTKSNVINIVAMTANFFHPVYRGRILSENQLKEVKCYIFESLDGNTLESVRLFNDDDGVFGALKRKKIISTKTYWHYAKEQGHKELAEYAMKFLKIPASTAQLERLFSNWAFVHDETRNRLSPEKSKKLTNIYFTLRSLDENDHYESDSD